MFPLLGVAAVGGAAACSAKKAMLSPPGGAASNAAGGAGPTGGGTVGAPGAGSGGGDGRAAPVTFPLGVSPNRRYLVDHAGVPFLIAGDSPQCLTARLSVADMSSFFTTRAQQGFNAA